MAFLYDLLVVLHFVGLAAIIGGYLTVLRSPRIVVGMVHGALLQILTGLLLVGLAEGLDRDVDNAKIGVKLVVALVVAGLAFAYRKRPASPAVVHAVGGLAVLNVVVAVFWG
ncbi:MAG: hypothetical protein ACOYXW_02140 [Actinomycetota bacterium]